MHDPLPRPGPQGLPPRPAQPAQQGPSAHSGPPVPPPFLPAVERDDAGRSEPGLLARLWSEPATRVLCLRDDGRALHDAGGLLLIEPGAVPSAVSAAAGDATGDDGPLVYLGRTARAGRHPAGTSVLSLALSGEQASQLAPLPGAWGDLREIAEELDEIERSLFATALAMRNWHDSHGYSPRSGAATLSGSAGWVRAAPGEGPVFPRTDAAVIAAVFDRDDRILLGRNARWAQPRFSLFAGFVEPGESFEEAVAREVLEEAGARITRPRYAGSQPWPFPASIMVGFTCELDPGQDPGSVQPDGTEIVELRWWTREQIAGQLELLPGRSSIARRIIEEWRGGRIGR